MDYGRSEEELAGGFLRCRVGASTRDMQTLKMRAEREWKVLLAERLTGLAEVEVGEADFTDFGNPNTLKAIAPLANLPSDLMLDLVVAYDRGGALGGREFLEENADSGQLFAILMRIGHVVFPFVTSLRSLIVEVLRLRALSALPQDHRSGALNSTNGASPTGELTPTA